MKALLLSIGLFVLPLFHLNSGKIMEKDMYEYLEETSEKLEDDVSDLSEAQLNFKPNAETWSVAECLEHIIKTEGELFKALQQTLENDQDEAGEVSMDDAALIAMITNRDQKAKASPNLLPENKYASSEEALEAFETQREEIKDYLKDSDADMYAHTFDFPFATVDAHQLVLFLAGHTARHTLQIEEVMADPGFPAE